MPPNRMSSIIGGVEGGATHSTAVLLNPEGSVLAKVKGSGTNHHLIGMEECQFRIVNLINKAKAEAGLPTDVPLSALGLSLSGCELEETNRILSDTLSDKFPNLAREIVIGSDTEGSLAATFKQGGVTCIAGTGSNTLLVNPDGTKFQCGGWGYMLGDEGGAWKIAWRAVKYCFDDLDNFEKSPYDITQVWDLVKGHFDIETQANILDSFYKRFDKAFIASLCKKLADLARRGDALSQHIFKEAGTHLARNIYAVFNKAAPALVERKGGLHVLCVGSVWLSWDLLEEGFVKWIRSKNNVKNLSLLRLKTEVAIGGALMAANKLSLRLDVDYKKNYDIFYVYNFQKACVCIENNKS